jgi:hypothetical protein
MHVAGQDMNGPHMYEQPTLATHVDSIMAPFISSPGRLPVTRYQVLELLLLAARRQYDVFEQSLDYMVEHKAGFNGMGQNVKAQVISTIYGIFEADKYLVLYLQENHQDDRVGGLNGMLSYDEFRERMNRIDASPPDVVGIQ